MRKEADVDLFKAAFRYFVGGVEKSYEALVPKLDSNQIFPE
jgi:hypothetical protein